jgi:hypothetical protein
MDYAIGLFKSVVDYIQHDRMDEIAWVDPGRPLALASATSRATCTALKHASLFRVVLFLCLKNGNPLLFHSIQK